MSDAQPVQVCDRCGYSKGAHADGRFGRLCPDGSGWCWQEPHEPDTPQPEEHP